MVIEDDLDVKDKFGLLLLSIYLVQTYHQFLAHRQNHPGSSSDRAFEDRYA